MDIAAAATAAGSTGSTALSDRVAIADNLDTFLQLLTVQLRNQDPLDPINTNDFTQQLVQFSSVEQSVKSNGLLEQLVNASSNNSATTAVSYIGKNITAEGATTKLANDTATWTYKIDQSAPETTITIRNASGAVVFSESKELFAGTSTYQWDGKTNAGNSVPEGLYTININAKNADGNTVNVHTTVDGKVDGVDMTGSEPLLLIGNQSIKLSAVRAVKQV